MVWCISEKFRPICEKIWREFSRVCDLQRSESNQTYSSSEKVDVEQVIMSKRGIEGPSTRTDEDRSVRSRREEGTEHPRRGSGGSRGRGRGRGRGRRGGRGTSGVESGGVVEEQPVSSVSEEAVQEEVRTIPALSLADMEGRVEELTFENNELKKKVNELNGQLLCKDTAMKTMSLHVKRLEEEQRKTKAEMESLRIARKEIVTIPVNRTRRTAKGTMKLSETVEEEHLGIVLQVDKMIGDWCRREVSELEQFVDKAKREWTGRGMEVTSRGIVCSGGRAIAPYPPTVLAREGRLFTASAGSEEQSLRAIVNYELGRDAWHVLKGTPEEKERTVKAVCENRILRTQLRRVMSDTSSYKKRIIRDSFFLALQYDKLLSKNVWENGM